jgi:hypothetical protein
MPEAFYLISFFSPYLLSAIHLDAGLGSEGVSAGTRVSGPDLLITLLAISSLTESAAFAYLCLPRDRVEVRLASLTKSALIAVPIEPEIYQQWCRELPPAEKTALVKLLLGLMSPRDGLGGWFGLTPDDFNAAMGEDMWDRFSRYVDNHFDNAWVRLCMMSLATAMTMGLMCLFYRYFGLYKLPFHPIEFGTIVLLLILNVTVALILVSLAFGYQHGEHKISARINYAVKEVTPHLERWNRQRAENDLEILKEKVSEEPSSSKHRKR